MKQKTIFLLVIFLSFSYVLKAQESNNVKTQDAVYKQVAGDKSFEVNFNPGKIFGSDTGDQFSLFDGGIKFRSFGANIKTAFRIDLNLSLANETNIIQQANPEYDQLELKENLSIYAVMVKPGFEKHFTGIKRLSPYIGIQGLIGYSISIYKHENQYNYKIYEEKWVNASDETGYGSVNVGVGVFAGFDFYFVKKLYLGIELGYGLGYNYFLNTKYTNEHNSDLNYVDKNGYSFGMSPALATGNLRFGWTFK